MARAARLTGRAAAQIVAPTGARLKKFRRQMRPITSSPILLERLTITRWQLRRRQWTQTMLSIVSVLACASRSIVLLAGVQTSPSTLKTVRPTLTMALRLMQIVRPGARTIMEACLSITRWSVIRAQEARAPGQRANYIARKLA